MNFNNERFPDESLNTLQNILSAKFNSIQISKFTDWLAKTFTDEYRWRGKFYGGVDFFAIGVDKISNLIIFSSRIFYATGEMEGISFVEVIDSLGNCFSYQYKLIQYETKEIQLINKLINGNSLIILQAKADIEIEGTLDKAFKIIEIENN